MSLYEVLVVVALAAVGGFAYRLYRQDTKPGAPKPPESGQPMFGRDREPRR